jgi:hypothetical protein
MYELKINSTVIGKFKTLRAARAYEPNWIEAMEAGIDPITGSYTRIISKVRPSLKSFTPSQTSLESNHESL